MGKTLISIIWASRFDIIIVFSPLRQHARQNLERFRTQIDKYDEYILVDSDGIRDIDQIRQHLNKKIILSVTYKSSLPASSVSPKVALYFGVTLPLA